MRKAIAGSEKKKKHGRALALLKREVLNAAKLEAVINGERVTEWVERFEEKAKQL